MTRITLRSLAGGALASCLVALATPGHALTVTTTQDATTLSNALLAPTPGITITGATLLLGNPTQQGTFTGFNLAPTTGVTPTLTLPNGVVLTSGTAVFPDTNTVNDFNANTGTGPFAPLTDLAASAGLATNTFDANVLQLTFTVAPGNNAVALDFVFATDEFPTQSVTDIFGVFADGTAVANNFARFPGGELIANTPGNPANFILNPVGGGLYPIEFNGLTRVLGLTALLDTTLTEHTLTLAIADTNDTIFQSAAFIANLRATTAVGGGGIGTVVPTPMSIALLGVALVGLAAARRRG